MKNGWKISDFVGLGVMPGQAAADERDIADILKPARACSSEIPCPPGQFCEMASGAKSGNCKAIPMKSSWACPTGYWPHNGKCCTAKVIRGRRVLVCCAPRVDANGVYRCEGEVVV